MVDVERVLVTEPCTCGKPDCSCKPRQSFAVLDKATGQKPCVGDMFFAPWALDPDFGESKESWAPHYLARPEPRRAPIVVVCPGPRWFFIDQRAYDFHNKGGWYGDGWNVAGEAPALTISPSIDLKGTWHGYLEAGWLKDDTDGRTYDAAGHLIPKAAA